MSSGNTFFNTVSKFHIFRVKDLNSIRSLYCLPMNVIVNGNDNNSGRLTNLCVAYTPRTALSRPDRPIVLNVTYVYIQTALCWKKNTVYVMCRRAKRRVVMVRLHTLSSWLPKHQGFARRYARESCSGFRVMSEVTSSVQCHSY